METLRVIFFSAFVAAVTANIDDALRSYETLHPAQLRHKIVKRDLSSNHPHIRQMEFDSLGRHFHLYLQRKKGLLSPGFKVVAVDSENNQREVGLKDSHPYEGYLIGDTSSEVHAMWEDEDNIAASIRTKDEVIVVEPSWRHLPPSENYSMIVYRKSDVKMDSDLGESFCGFVDANKDFKLGDYHKHYVHDPEEDKYKEHSSTHNAYTDDRYTYQNYAHHDKARPKRDAESESSKPRALPLTFTPLHTTCQVLLVADYLFFKNMGKSSLSKTSSYLIGLMDRVDALYRKTDFGSGFKGMGFEIKEIRIHENFTKNTYGKPPNFNQKLENPPWKTKQLLEAFSRDRPYTQFCLAHLFTYQAFTGGVLGLAYIGSPRLYSVGGICSPDYFKNRTRLYLNTGWSSALNRHDRRLLTQEADLVTTHEFGHNWGSEHDPDTQECSPSAFSGGKYIMYTYSVSGYDPNNKIFSPCSKRSISAVLLSKAQSCFTVKGKSFCGNSHVEPPDEECDVGPEGQKGLDPCCDENCRLKPAAKCSDMNDLCCKGCDFASNQTVCHEQLDDVPTCEGVANCTGHSASCPQPDKKANGSDCLQRGKCQNGKCIALCEREGLVSCICDAVATSCQWCCKANHNSTCVPYVNSTTNATYDLPDGMPCIQGSCSKGVCERQTQDLVQRIWKIIENITPDQLVEFMRANIVGTVIILSLVIWIPVSCVVSWRDRKALREEKESREWMQPENEELVRNQDPRNIRRGRHYSRQSFYQSANHSFRSFPKPLATNC